MTCPECTQIIGVTDLVGITQVHTVYHLACSSQLAYSEKIIDQGPFLAIFHVYLTETASLLSKTASYD